MLARHPRGTSQVWSHLTPTAAQNLISQHVVSVLRVRELWHREKASAAKGHWQPSGGDRTQSWGPGRQHPLQVQPGTAS